MIILFLFTVSMAQQLEFPYCWREMHGEIISTPPIVESNVGYSFECELACIGNPQCSTFSFSTTGSCKLYRSGYYEAMKNLVPNNLIILKTKYRCEFECDRRQAADCETVKPCTLAAPNRCVASCDEFVDENVVVENCHLSVNTIQCGGQKLPCSHGSIFAEEDSANLVCIGQEGCKSISAYGLNNVQCNECVSSVFDSISSLTADSLTSSDLINVEDVICRGCSFTNSTILQVRNMEVPTLGGLVNVNSMQAEIETLTCSVTGACESLNVNVNSLTCDGETGPSACSSSEFHALGDNTEVWCLGQNACDGSAFDNFDRVYCIGANSCENTLFVNVGDAFCYLDDASTQSCNSALSDEYFKNCIEWTGEDCVTRAPSISPSVSTPTAHPSATPSASPSTVPSLSPTQNPTIFIAVEAATRSCQINEWFDMHTTTCSICPDGTMPTHTKLDCATCSASSAGQGGTCEECAKYFYFPSSNATQCELDVVLVLVIAFSTASFLLSCYLWCCKGSTGAPEPVKKTEKTKKKKEKENSKKGNKPEKKARRNSMEKRKDSDKARRNSMEKRKRKNSDSIKKLDVPTKRDSPPRSRKNSIRKDPGQIPARRLSQSRSEGLPPRRRSMSRVRNESAGWQTWTPVQVSQFFEGQGLIEVAQAFRDAQVYGNDLQDLAYDDLCDLGFRTDEIKRFDGLMNVLTGTSSV